MTRERAEEIFEKYRPTMQLMPDGKHLIAIPGVEPEERAQVIADMHGEGKDMLVQVIQEHMDAQKSEQPPCCQK